MSKSLRKDESSTFELSESVKDNKSETLDILKSSLLNCSIVGENVREEMWSPLSMHLFVNFD